MLILTRRGNESFVIGNDIKVTVLSVRGSQVRLGIDAPKDISVHREEIYRLIKDNLTSSSSFASSNEDDDDQDNRGNIILDCHINNDEQINGNV